MKLTETQIQGIDTYLKNSEIEFVDVRMEMLDHVASEVEYKMVTEKLDFYDAFKNYMVVNKKQLQKQNKQFTKTTDIKVLKAISKFLIKPTSLLVFGLSFFALKLASNHIDLLPILRFAPIAILFSMSIYYYFITHFRKKERYSGLERIGIILIFFTQLIQIFFNPTYEINPFEGYQTINFVVISFLVVIALGFMVTLLKLKKEYTERYKNKFI